MTTPAGQIAFTDIQTEFGGSNPIALTEYYSNGTYVPSGLAGVPSSGAISADNLRNKTKRNWGTFNSSILSQTEGYNYYFYITNAVGANVTLSWEILFDSNVSSADFTRSSGTLDSMSGSFGFSGVNDGIVEGNGSFRVQVKYGATIIFTSATHYIIDGATYTMGAASVASIYRCGSGLDRSVSAIVYATGAAEGTPIYWKVSPNWLLGDLSPTDLVAVSGVSYVNNAGAALVTATATEILSGNDNSEYKQFMIQTYTDASYVQQIGSTSFIGIFAAPRFTLSFNPSYTYEDDTSSCYIDVSTTNFPNASLRITTFSSSAVYGTDHNLSDGYITITNGYGSLSFNVLNNSGSNTSHTLVANIYRYMYSSPLIATTSMTIYQALPVVNNIASFNMFIFSGGTQGSDTRIFGGITSISKRSFDRTFEVWSTINGGAWTKSDIVLTVYKDATASASVQFHRAAGGNATAFATSFSTKAVAATYTDSPVATLTDFWY